ncbi:thiamine phosphate synthase [Methylopila jiangsuensis]|uniref:Thiamine phosphate synthase n=1 Tax=Methylopila jiangsuensis TaxID=586230 RepID=A0A9W6JJH5_9HYPH|nr:thiamine phosphate synthase [Methylopila jiangsuensis]MDR6286443.1 thiamine-phosphate pyrophosphorylase [Methylopila jiangsuensis]GLK77219.1 thiamine phosphate synthase [Methylopila jiangsuensis]
MSDDAPTTRLTLVTPELSETDAFLPALEAALAAGDVAAVVLRLAPADDRTRAARAKPLIAAVQAAGAAALIAGDGVEDIVGKSGADGLHLFGAGGVADAIERFQPEKIVGVATPPSRDDAMTAGELGADYILFGLSPSGAAWESDRTLDRVAWWVPIFETPCVGFAGSIDDVSAIAAAGAEFVALGDAVWRAENGPAAAVASAMAMISLARTPAP